MAGAGVHDNRLPQATIEAIAVDQPEPNEADTQPLWLDEGYYDLTGRETVGRISITLGTFGGSARRSWMRRNANGNLPAAGWRKERSIEYGGFLLRYARKACRFLGPIQRYRGLPWFRRQDGWKPLR